MNVAAEQQQAALRLKKLATIRAQLALANFELCELPGGGFVIRKWGLHSRELPDLPAVEGFARMVGVRIEQ